MPYEVSNKNNTYFVTQSIDGRVMARFDGRDGSNAKEEAITKAKTLANEEKVWKKGIS